MKSTIGIIGLGLIGGSFAKALRARTSARVLAFDIDPEVTVAALTDGSITGVLGSEDLPECDFVIIALRPNDALDWFLRYADKLAPNTIVFDVAGVKRIVSKQMEPTAAHYGLRFISAHPMAGYHEGGYSNASEDMFDGASFIICDEDIDDVTLDELKKLIYRIGFDQVIFTSADNHDDMIAFTSQLAHIVSSAFVKDPAAQTHAGYSAGSFQDMTRVAILDPEMWSELCVENADKLIEHLDILSENLAHYRAALEARDSNRMTELFRDGVEAKRRSMGTPPSHP